MTNTIQNLKKPEYAAAASAFFCGLLIHMYGLVNILHNTDDINYQFTGYGTGVASGRWMLTLLGDFLLENRLNYNLGYFNGVLFLALVAVAAGMLTALFRIRSLRSAALLGLVVASFPTVCSTLLYKFTTPFYGLAIVLALAAVWVLPKYKLLGLLLSACCTALALAIYQAYLPLTAAVFVLQLLRDALEEDVSFRVLLRTGVYACLSMVLGLILYFAATNYFLDYFGKTLNDYQGISGMGNLEITQIPTLVANTYGRFFDLATGDYCNLVPNRAMRLAYGLLFALNGAVIGAALILKKRSPGNAVMAVVLCILFPVAVNLIEIMCPDSRIYTLMVLSCVVPLIMPLALLEIVPRKGRLNRILAGATAAVLLTLAAGNTYFTNLTYTKAYYVNQQTRNYIASLVTQVRMTEGFRPDQEWAFVGKISDPLLNTPWQNVTVYGGVVPTDEVLSGYSWKRWIPAYVGYAVPMADADTIAALQETDGFRQMPCWPSEGSIRVIDDVIVIKFQQE